MHITSAAIYCWKTDFEECVLKVYILGELIMTETILGLTVLNTVLILYMYRVIKNHHFYYGRPEEDWLWKRMPSL